MEICNDSHVYVACLIDITSFFEDKSLVEKCGGKIFYSGFFNDSVAVHICSFVTNVYVEVIDIISEDLPDDENDRIDIEETLTESHTIYDSGYYKISDITKMRKSHPERFKVIDINFSEPGLSDTVKSEEIREALSGDPIF